MGSTPQQIEGAIAMDKDGAQFALGHETPQTRVFVPDFYLGIYVVTNRQFARFLSAAQPRQDQLELWISSLARISPRVSFENGGVEDPVAQRRTLRCATKTMSVRKYATAATRSVGHNQILRPNSNSPVSISAAVASPKSKRACLTLTTKRFFISPKC
ncbi:MAG TPA: hypothetical protein DCG89_01070 [Spartobacteria bacterium]|nr:hypothetical protein [Spartobacteria bacterium]